VYRNLCRCDIISAYAFKKGLIVTHILINNLSSRFCLFALHFINEVIFSFNIPTNPFLSYH
jgi:hypothetical protein